MLKSLNNFISLYIDTFKLFGRFKAWLLLLCIFLVNWLILYSHYQYTNPLFYNTITWWTELWDAKYAGGFTHYPGHFILLPYYFSYAKQFVGILIEGGLLGAAALVFYRYIYTETEIKRYTIKETLKNWMHLTLGWGILNGILAGGYYYLPKVLDTFLWASPRRQMMFDYGLIPFFTILIVALFFFTIPYIAIYRSNVLSGVKNSLLIFIKRPIFMLFISGSLMLVPIIISLILKDPSVLVEKFRPELIYWLLLFGIVNSLFVNFFWMGIAVNFISEEE